MHTQTDAGTNVLVVHQMQIILLTILKTSHDPETDWCLQPQQHIFFSYKELFLVQSKVMSSDQPRKKHPRTFYNLILHKLVHDTQMVKQCISDLCEV